MKAGFVPAVWPEETAPAGAADCMKCDLCKQRTRVVWGEGNPEAPIVVILDNLGEREDSKGNAYVCGTRQTLQLAAWEMGLSMEDLHVTYILKCRPLRRYPKEDTRNACMPYLLKQIEEQKPLFALCLGNTATRCFFGSEALEVKQMRGAWHTARGIQTVVSYHPLAVRRRPNLFGIFISDWALLAEQYRNECIIGQTGERFIPPSVHE